MTSKRTLQLNFVVFSLFFGVAAFLLLIFGISQLAWYYVAGQLEIGMAFWILSLLGIVGCFYAIYLFSRRLRKKMAEMVS